jgi:DNA-binding response OmpR family regulator
MTKNETILVIEDDSTLLRVLKDNLEFQGYLVRTAGDGEAGLRAALEEGSDLILLDIMLPKINGYEICRQLRAKGLDVPILMLTAKGQEEDAVLGLNLGADDYVTKPFSLKELLARVEAFLRRRRREDSRVYRFGDYALDFISCRLTRADVEIELTPKELKMLLLMVKREGRALTRDQILDAVWGNEVFVTTRSVDRCINTLRKKIEIDPHEPRFIQTVREIGYRFERA